MFQDPLSVLFWAGWIITMVLGLALVGFEAYRALILKRPAIPGESRLSKITRFVFQIGVNPEESISCQVTCRAPVERVMDEVKDLITFHRPCLQYPLSEYWWSLNYCDYSKACISAVLRYRQDLLPITVELIWKFRPNDLGEVYVILEWFRFDLWESQHKHNVLLSMCAYTEERIRQLNERLELQSVQKNVPVAISVDSDKLRQRALALADKEREATIWPSPQDYNEAIQNPQSCFTDPELRNGEVELNALGMPRAASGAFASVYKLHCQSGDYAVRCFLSPVRDQKIRYGILTKHLAAQPCSSIVEFEFLDDGMCIRDKSFPMLKMEWVEGLPLHVYVEQNLDQSEEIKNLRRSFREMISGLRESKIAHGDLQHGNIIVRQKQLILVDYDGIFVPELVRFRSNELGHPNYQHPKRGGRHFGLFLDNFAGWLIDTSLVCLEEDPQLWQRFNGGDECLLFRRTDLLRPNESALFSALQQHESVNIRKSVEYFLSLLQMELEEIPFLDSKNRFV